MLYLLVSLVLIVAAVGLYIRSRMLNLPMPTSTKVTLGVFLTAGLVMTWFSVKEIEPYQYKRVEKIAHEFPELKPMIAERLPVIQRYEYLEILEAETDAKKELTR